MNGAPHRARRRMRGPIVLVLLVAPGLLFSLTGGSDLLALDALTRVRGSLLGFASERPLLACALFLALYVAVTALSIPGASVLTLVGGFLFGAALATPLVVVGATIGAVFVFSLARTALGASLRARAGTRFERLAAGFRENAFSYLLALRLVPLFPFWLVNLAPALLGVRLAPFAAATALGVVPGTLVYANLGAGLGALIERGEPIDLASVADPSILLPLCGLAALALFPVLWRRLRRRYEEHA